jgi:hypothetical protein
MAVIVYVPDVPEFLPLVLAAGKVSGCSVEKSTEGYWKLQGARELRFSRKAMGLGPAIWNSALCGGFIGRIVEYGRDEMILASED